MRIFTALVVLLLLSLGGFVVYQTKVLNPEIARELRAQPDGARAARVMLMTIDDRKTIPVNYLREDDKVFIGADGPWWREMRDQGQPVTMLIKGEVFAGQAKAVSGQPEYTKEVVKRLRPDVPKWLPSWLSGVLVVIELKDFSESPSAETKEIESLRNSVAPEPIREIFKEVNG